MADAPLDPNEYGGIKKYKVHGKNLIDPRSGFRYMVVDTNNYYNDINKMAEYHIDTFTIFQDICDDSGHKGKFVGWLIVRINEGEHPVICMGQDEAILK